MKKINEDEILEKRVEIYIKKQMANIIKEISPTLAELLLEEADESV